MKDRRLENLLRRVERAKTFGANTGPYDRHLHMMARNLAAGRPYPMLQEEPQHCAYAMLVALECLYKFRNATGEFWPKRRRK